MDDAAFDAVLVDVSKHGNLSEALRQHRISQGTFHDRVRNHDDDAKRYARAKELGCHAVADETRRLMDQHVESLPDDATAEQVMRYKALTDARKLQADTRKWHLAKILPHVYGDRTIVSGDADNPVEVRHSIASRLLPELAARDSGGALVAIDGGRAGSARLRVGVLGPAGATAAAGDVDLLADEGGPGLGQDAKRG